MIYTCTCNPSLDYYLSMPQLQKGKLNRSDFELYAVGGKGVNVSIILNNLGIRSTALGFLGGFIKDYYLKDLDKYPFIMPMFVPIKGNSRIDIRIMDQEETYINASGPVISEEEFRKLERKLKNIYDDDIFVLSGQVQESAVEPMIALVKELSSNGIRVFLDTNRRIIDECASENIYFIRFTDEDLQEGENHLELIQKLKNTGARNILYGEKGKELYFHTGNKLYSSNYLNEENISENTSVSNLLGGYLYSLLKGGSALECFKFGIAASLATGLSDVKTSQDQIMSVFEKVRVTECE